MPILFALKNNPIIGAIVVLFILLSIVNGIHFLMNQQLRTNRFLYITELQGFPRRILFGFAIIVFLAVVANWVFGTSDLFIIIPSALSCYYVIIVSIIWRRRLDSRDQHQ